MNTQTKKIPNGWMEMKLGGIVNIKSGKRLPKGKSVTKNKTNHPYIRIIDIKNNHIYEKNVNFITNDVFYILSKYIVNSGDVILSIVGTVGNVAKVSDNLDKANLTENCVKFINLKDLSNSYLYYFLISNTGQNEILKNCVGAVQKKLPIYGIENIDIKLPSIIEQRAIAGVLGSLDDKIELLRQQNQTLEEIGQTLFHKWFVEDADKTIPATDVLNFERGIEVGSNNYLNKKKDGLLPFYRVADIKDINTDNTKTFVKKELLKEGVFNKDDILVSFDGTVGRVFVGGEGGYSSGMRKLKIKEDSNLYSKSFIYFWAKSDAVQNTIKSHATGTTILHAGKSIDFLRIQSDGDLIKKFSEATSPFFEKIILNISQIKTLETMRDTLLPKLVSGEVRVKLK